MEKQNYHVKWLEWIVKFALITIASFAVNYLKEIGRETATLSLQFLELKYEIKRLADANINYAEKLQNIEERLKKLEDKR
jgi:hypothetical protein